MNKIPAQLDLSVLEFLQYGDLESIARWDRQENGKKTIKQYVWQVLNGKKRNDRILKKAFEIALKRQGEFPKQVLKVA